MNLSGVLAFLVTCLWRVVEGDDCEYVLDLLLAQDVSGSFADDMANVANAVDALMKDLVVQHFGSRFKLTTFTDVPLYPYGCEAKSGWYNDHAFRDRTEWTTDNDYVQQILKDMRTEWGVDTNEAQLLHLAHIADLRLFDEGAETRHVPERLQRVIVLATDHDYHTAGDLLYLTPKKRAQHCASEMAVEKGYAADCCDPDAEVTIRPYDGGSILYEKDPMTQSYQDYPTIEYTATRLAEENISVVFLLTDEVYDSGPYKKLIAAILAKGGYATSVLLSEDSANLYAAVTHGLTQVAEHICNPAEKPTFSPTFS
eukprot:Lankesteria_metandrocarpae@DN5074_c0_g1_i3.p1